MDQISGGFGPSDKGWWGMEGGRSSRPRDKAGGDWARSQKNFFGPFGTQFGLKIRGSGGGTSRTPPLDPPMKKLPDVLKGLLNVPAPYFLKTFVSFSETPCT